MGVREHIVDAFNNTPMPEPGDVSVPTYDDEDTADYFTGKAWQGHTVRALREHESSMCFFTPGAFRYYLPAFMLAELEDPETADVIAEGILFHLYNGSRSHELLAVMVDREREAVALFFEECAKRYDREEFASAAEQIRRAAG